VLNNEKIVLQMKDKATVEMECMEEGYLAKIVRKEGEKEIKVGEVLILYSSPHFSFSLT
jgi:pyruvate/2-oxoglutarate dehydrogenase complex dihydrolipoamide acyltransferase (E2) component